MRSRLSSALAAVALSSAMLLPAGAASASVSSASPAGAASASVSSAWPASGSISASSTAPNPSGSPSTPGPVDPGTGETPAAKQNRVDYAPYVIAAAVILALAAAALVWRRSKGGPSSRNLRHADKNTNEGGPDDRRSDH